jgi:hypothetical protein
MILLRQVKKEASFENLDGGTLRSTSWRFNKNFTETSHEHQK